MEAPNIMSSAAEPDRGEGWLSESRYREALDELSPLQSKSITLTDGREGVPRFADDLNFIASATPRHWFLVTRDNDRKEPRSLPFLVPSNRLASLVEAVSAGDRSRNTGALAEMTRLFPPAPPLPSLGEPESVSPREGFHEDGEGYVRLGLYNRRHVYSCLFLDELCYMCRRSDIARIHLTAEHELIIRKIPAERLNEWKRFLNKHGVNLRHGSAALGWRVLESGLVELKNNIVKHLVDTETGTGDLSFVMARDFLFLESTVAVEPVRRFPGRLRYNLYHRADFHAQAGRWFPFRMQLRERELPEAVRLLCETYRNRFALQLGDEVRASIEKHVESAREGAGDPAAGRHECPECLTIYDPSVGDPFRDIAPGTNFEQLPENYACFVCDEPKHSFRPVTAEVSAV